MTDSSQLPTLRISGSDEQESEARGGGGSEASLCVRTHMHGVLTFHSPSSGWVSCTGELPWELRVWEGST